MDKRQRELALYKMRKSTKNQSPNNMVNVAIKPAMSADYQKLMAEEKKQKKIYLNQCFREYGLDDRLNSEMSRDEYREALGILPRATYGCTTPECQEQNRLSEESQRKVRDSELGKKIDCVERCVDIKMMSFGRMMPQEPMAQQAMIERDARIVKAYEERCASSMKKKPIKVNTNNIIMLVAGGIIVYSLLNR